MKLDINEEAIDKAVRQWMLNVRANKMPVFRPILRYYECSVHTLSKIKINMMENANGFV